jgi:hypothetical protein
MKTATALGLDGTLLFHLNLNYSSIEVAQRRTVIARCYEPLLDLAEQRPWLRLALEASGHTLERLERLAPEWIARLGRLIEAGRIELVGSGDTQLIGPLVPAEVNRWNQELGRETYRRLFGFAPRVALVNEMAWSQGLVDAYLDAGYEAVITDWNNPRRAHPEWPEELRYRTAWTQSPTGRRIRVLWADALLFQGFQRAVMGELEPERFVEDVRARAGERARHVFLYANDAEVFDFRPGRYASEPPLGQASEWPRMGALLDALRAQGVAFTTPERVLDDPRLAPQATLELSTAANPIPVKKQPKYNVTRWALSGWDDVGINARCFARAKSLASCGGSAQEWRLLCRAWGSDLRTHLTEKRWQRFHASLPGPARVAPEATGFHEAPLRSRRVERGGRRMAVGTEGVRVVLDLRRGMALDALTLCQAGPAPLLGTLPLGHFDDIDWAADFYSGHSVLEVPGEKRVTDLERVEPEVEEREDCVSVRALVPTALGALPKEVRVYAHRIELRYGFSAWGARPRASLRAGALTLLEGALDDELWISCANGGARERMRLTEDCDHARSVSALVSASTAFGATDGCIALDDGRSGFEVSWPQEECAPLPLLTCRRVAGKRFVRLVFSLAELDETHRPGATLHDLCLSIRPCRNRR